MEHEYPRALKSIFDSIKNIPFSRSTPYAKNAIMPVSFWAIGWNRATISILNRLSIKFNSGVISNLIDGELIYSPLDIEEEVQLQLVFGNVPLGIASTEAFSVGVFFVGLLSKA